MKKLLFIAIIAVLGCTALQAKNRIRIKRESWEVKASTRVPISPPLNLYYEGIREIRVFRVTRPKKKQIMSEFLL